MLAVVFGTSAVDNSLASRSVSVVRQPGGRDHVLRKCPSTSAGMIMDQPLSVSASYGDGSRKNATASCVGAQLGTISPLKE